MRGVSRSPEVRVGVGTKQNAYEVAMADVYAEVTLTNLFNKMSTGVRARVDNAIMNFVITPWVAEVLGYDVLRCATKRFELPDGREVEAPFIEGIGIEFEDRTCMVRACVLEGENCVMGRFPLEYMDLIVDAKEQRLVGVDPGGPRLRISSAALYLPCPRCGYTRSAG